MVALCLHMPPEFCKANSTSDRDKGLQAAPPKPTSEQAKSCKRRGKHETTLSQARHETPSHWQAVQTTSYRLSMNPHLTVEARDYVSQAGGANHFSQAKHETTSHRHAVVTCNLEHKTILLQAKHDATSNKHAVLTWNLEHETTFHMQGMRLLFTGMRC